LVGVDTLQLCGVGLQRCEPHIGRGIALVGQIIRAAGKGVDHPDRRAKMGGQQRRGDREIFVMLIWHAGSYNY
jgi:hypothetical protein